MNYQGVIALVFAVSLGASYLLAVGALAYWGRPVTEQGAEVLMAIGGAMCTAVGVYIGQKFK